MAVDQHLGDARPRLVELRGAMGRLAKQDDATIAEPLDEIAQLVQIAEGLRGLRHEPAHTVVDGERALGRQEQPSGKARRLGVHLHFLDALALGLSPAFLPDQGHESHSAEFLLLEAVLAGAANAHQRLKAERPDGDNQPAANRKLLLQRFGNMGTAGRDDDGLEGRLLRQALGAIGTDDLDIAIAEPLQPRGSELCQLLVALDGEHLVGHAARHRRGVA